MTRSEWIGLLTQVLHLSVREGMMLTLGQVMDLQEHEIRRGRLKRKEN